MFEIVCISAVLNQAQSVTESGQELNQNFFQVNFCLWSFIFRVLLLLYEKDQEVNQ